MQPVFSTGQVVTSRRHPPCIGPFGFDAWLNTAHHRNGLAPASPPGYDPRAVTPTRSPTPRLAASDETKGLVPGQAFSLQLMPSFSVGGSASSGTSWLRAPNAAWFQRALERLHDHEPDVL